MTPPPVDYVDDPMHVDSRGNTATTDRNGWLRDLIWAVLFTTPGERVHRPDFGSGLLQLVFAPEHSELASTVQVLVHGSLRQWLGHLVEINDVGVDVIDTTVLITVQYTVRATGAQRTDQFTTAGAA